jgi:ribose transport system permease protein
MATKSPAVTTSKSPAVKLQAPKFEKYTTIFAWLIMFVVFSIVSHGFFSAFNLINLFRQISMLAIVVCGLTICISAGDWDLSVGRVAGLAGIITVSLINRGVPTGVAVLAAFASGVIIGCINGLLITGVGIPSLIVTLGMMTVTGGLSLTWTGGMALYQELPKNYTFWGSGYLFSVPAPIYIMVIIVFCTYLLLNKTRTGRYLYAIGGNKTVASLSGINVRRYRFAGLVASGFLASLEGFILMARLGSGQPTGGGEFMLEGLGSVFLGVTAIKVGKPNVLGSIAGVLIMGTLSNGLTIAGVNAYPQEIIKGSIMIAAVVAAVLRSEITI